jgi:hypothetical protein
MGTLGAIQHFDGASLGVGYEYSATLSVYIAMVEFTGCMGRDRDALLEP